MNDMLYKKIRELVAILKAEDIDELELRHWWTTVRIARRRPVREAAAAETTAHGSAARIPTAAAAAEGSVAGVPTPVHAREVAAEVEREAYAGADVALGGDTDLKKIVSPMVGTFYRAPAPDSDPFVNVGDHVEIGEVLCVIEAMKLMNEIEADRSGVIKRILVQDNQPVEFGQPLFLVESA
jgi:acetyl-CoA carboxylase biotin carboxyl carrier protein